jgi:hypothetical protein
MHESRLDNTVNGGDLGFGEDVDIRTKMGEQVARGTVQTVTPFGVIIKESEGGQQKFYKTDLYLFSPVIAEPENRVVNVLTDMSLDARVEAKLKAMGEAGDPGSDSSGASKIEPGADEKGDRAKDAEPSKPEKDDPDAGKKDDDKKLEPSKKKKEKETDKEPVAKTDSSVDVDDLPDDIKNAIVSSSEMDEAQLNSVLGEISDAAMKGLKRSNVKETEIFGLVQQIQDATYEILTGKEKE